MAGTAHLLILTAHSATTSSFPRPNPLFLASRRCHLHSAVKSFTLRPAVYVPSPFRACAQSHQIDGSGGKEAKGLTWVEPILRFARGNVLPLALISAVTLGLTYPSLGCAVDKYHVSKIGPFGIFVISGLVLRSEEIGAAVEAWPVGLFGLVSGNGWGAFWMAGKYSPPIYIPSTKYKISRPMTDCWLWSHGYTNCASVLLVSMQVALLAILVNTPLNEDCLQSAQGLAIFCCMPTTLSSGVALTQLAGANSALALAMTVISNLLGILINNHMLC
ncbi:Na+-bile acid cotransporter [Trifolium pratense]|uniref:Na+-bile acid cotransporter n=1 Tax=Trifolium pratense TaxID=57577 RepID=A0A2K3NMB4_TRIPR|nr:Na+-bile acid cotransporter [Trifolium pratense]